MMKPAHIDEKQPSERGQVLRFQRGKAHSPRPVRVKSVRDAQRLLARIILQFQKGELDIPEAKTLAYLLSIYVQNTRDFEVEQKLQAIEEKISKGAT